jgi:hypothetical protein
MSLSPAEIELASVAARQPRLDHSLKALMILARIGGTPVSLLVDGALMTGTLAASVAWGERLDQVMKEALPDDLEAELVSAGWPDEIVGELAATFRSSFAERERQGELKRIKHFENMRDHQGNDDPSELKELQDDLAREEIYSRDADFAFITLRDARVADPAGEIEVPMMRVMAAHVGAWWPGTTGAPERS